MKSIFSVPILRNGKTVGVLTLDGQADLDATRFDQLSEKLSKDVALPRGLRLKVVDERVLTEEGKRATKKGVLILDEVAS